MFKLISAIFTAGVVVGVALVVRQRHIANKAEQPVAPHDHSNNDSNSDGVTERQEPVTVPEERP